MITADSLIRQFDVQNAAIRDGRAGRPDKYQKVLSDTEEKIKTECEGELHGFATKQYNALKGETADLKSEITKVSTSYNVFLDGLKSDIRASKNEWKDQISFAKEDMDNASTSLDAYCEVHDQPRDEASLYEKSLINTIGLGMFILLVESALNSAFLQQAGNIGLILAYVLAGVISLINIGFGFITGFLFLRYHNHKKIIPKIYAYICFPIALILGFLFNVAVGQYRDLLENQKNKEVSIENTDLIPSTSLGEIDLFATPTILSLILMIVGSGIFLGAIYKGYKMFGTYPGLAKRHRIFAEAQQKYRAANTDFRNLIEENCAEMLQKLSLKADENHRINQRYTRFEEKYYLIKSAIENTKTLLQSECNSAIAFYRDTNKKIRPKDEDALATNFPEYFLHEVELETRADYFSELQIDELINDFRDKFKGLKQEEEKVREKIEQIMEKEYEDQGETAEKFHPNFDTNKTE